MGLSQFVVDVLHVNRKETTADTDTMTAERAKRGRTDGTAIAGSLRGPVHYFPTKMKRNYYYFKKTKVKNR
jgi:hypothetical protein